MFFRALGGMIDGFTERAPRVGALLEDPGTTFLIVTAPRHDPVEEAIFFHRKLRRRRMPFGGLVVNRLHRGAGAATRPAAAPPSSARTSPAAWRPPRTSWRRSPSATRANVEHLRSRLGDPPTIVVPELDGDVHDVEGLALVREHLFGDVTSRR